MTVNRSFNYREMESPLWMTYQENSNTTLAHKLCLVGQWQHTNTHKKPVSDTMLSVSSFRERVQRYHHRHSGYNHQFAPPRPKAMAVAQPLSTFYTTDFLY